MTAKAEEETGRVTRKGIEKEMTPSDQERMEQAVDLSREILPESMGNPPILTIMALAKKIAGILKE